MDTFKYKIHKTVDLGLAFSQDLLISSKNTPKDFEGKINEQLFQLHLPENYRVQDIVDSLIHPLRESEALFGDIFEFDAHNTKHTIITDGTELFFSKEKKKLPREKNRKPESYYYDSIYKIFEEKFQRFSNDVTTLEELIQTSLDNQNRVVDILKKITHIQSILGNLIVFGLHYEYSGHNDRKIAGLENLKTNTVSLQNFTNFLGTIAKKGKNGELLCRIALNPVIVNSSGEINKKVFEDRIKKLETDILPSLEGKVRVDKEIKQEFLTGIDKYLNNILFKEGFFRQSNNHHYKQKCIDFYDTIQSHTNGNNIHNALDLVTDFIKHNPIGKDSIFPYEQLTQELEKQSYSIQKTKVGKEVTEGIDGLEIDAIDFKNLNKIRYRLSWLKTELKKKGDDTEKLTGYIRILKRKIHDMIEEHESLYNKFLESKKRNAMNYGQARGEYILKKNYDIENSGYDNFGLFIQGNEGDFHLYISPKEHYKQELERIKKLPTGSDKVIHFESITPKGLYKLAFLKKAFASVDEHNFTVSYKDKNGNDKKNGVDDLYKKKSELRQKELNVLIDYFKACIDSDIGKKLFKSFQFQFQKTYENLTDFEKDISKAGYVTQIQSIDIKSLNPKNLFQLSLNQKKLIANKGSDLNLLNLFLAGEYEKVRMMPEIKLFYREQSESIQEKKVHHHLKDKKIIQRERYTKPSIRASFGLEVNPIEHGQNPINEKIKFFENIKKSKADICYYGIDLGEKDFAVVGRYDKNLNIIPIQVDGKNVSFLNLTNAKIENGKIMIQSSYKNDEKYNFIKKFYEKILNHQQNLKEILESIGSIEVGDDFITEYKSGQKALNKEVYQTIINKIDEGKFDPTMVQKYFGGYKGLGDLIAKYFMHYVSNNSQIKEIIPLDHQRQIYKKLEFSKIINFKQAFGSNFVGIMKELIKEKPGVIVFENLWNNTKYKGKSSKDRNIGNSFGAYIGNYIFQSIVSGLSKVIDNNSIYQYIYIDKNITNTLQSSSLYGSNGVIIWVEAEGTSTLCPLCGNQLYRDKSKGIIQHDTNCPGKNGCGFQIDEQQHISGKVGSVELQDGEELATYNIAKRGIEYISSPEKFEDVGLKEVQKIPNQEPNIKRSPQGNNAFNQPKLEAFRPGKTLKYNKK